MSNITETQQDSSAQDSVTKEFAKLLEESFEINQINEGKIVKGTVISIESDFCLLYTSPSPRDLSTSRMPSSA